MKIPKQYDFSGYATRHGIKCSDGRTIMKGAFQHCDGITVPLVWQHIHNEPDNILGHAILESRDDGMYTYGTFNDTPKGQQARELVKHGDITALSIYANGLKQQGQSVLHGEIREVSLVLSGANAGAYIDNVSIAHADGSYTIDEEGAIIYSGVEIMKSKYIKHAQDSEEERTVADVFNEMSEEQKTAVYAIVAEALDDENEDEDEDEDNEDDEMAQGEEDLIHGGGDRGMKRNVFDNSDISGSEARQTLSHSQVQAIVSDAIKLGSLRQAFIQHATTYGIENIDYLFPDARNIQETPEFVQRQMEWVPKVFDAAKHTPFSRIKSMSADITYDTARAKGYIKGNLKKEEFFAIAKRITTPTTIYKKQKLDRDDIVDITDFNVVAWIKAEMRMMLNEEIARAVLISDGREPDDEDKISEAHIRPIAKEDPFYAHKIQVPANTSGSTLIDEILRSRKYYKGSGNPTLFTTEDILTDMLLVKDKMGRRLYNNETELASAIRVASIVPVELIDGITSDTGNLIAILVNMKDYTIGADKGGEIGMFDDFDIDYNQFKYLMETRISGCLTKHKSAIVFWRAEGTLVAPTIPTFVAETNTLTIPSKAGVAYTIDGVAASAGSSVITEDTIVDASPTTGYYFAPNTVSTWEFAFTPGE